MEFKVLSKEEIEDLDVQDNLNKEHILVSISGTDMNLPKLPKNTYRRNTFYMIFDDVEKGEEDKPYQLFSSLHAESLLTFVNGALEKFKNLEQIVVHCFAGISRSAGVAAALSKILNGDDTEMFKSKVPNMTVYRTILDKYYEEKIPEVIYPGIYNCIKR